MKTTASTSTYRRSKRDSNSERLGVVLIANTMSAPETIQIAPMLKMLMTPSARETHSAARSRVKAGWVLHTIAKPPMKRHPAASEEEFVLAPSTWRQGRSAPRNGSKLSRGASIVCPAYRKPRSMLHSGDQEVPGLRGNCSHSAFSHPA